MKLPGWILPIWELPLINRSCWWVSCSHQVTLYSRKIEKHVLYIDRGFHKSTRCVHLQLSYIFAQCNGWTHDSRIFPNSSLCVHSYGGGQLCMYCTSLDPLLVHSLPTFSQTWAPVLQHSCLAEGRVVSSVSKQTVPWTKKILHGHHFNSTAS